MGKELHWTNKQNDRRCDLIYKKFDDVLTAEEVIELEQLQTQMLAYRRKVAPRPIEEAKAARFQQEAMLIGLEVRSSSGAKISNVKISYPGISIEYKGEANE